MMLPIVLVLLYKKIYKAPPRKLYSSPREKRAPVR